MADENVPRRERIATACLAGMTVHRGNTAEPSTAARQAIAYADALIAELDTPADAPRCALCKSPLVGPGVNVCGKCIAERT
jgi:hypothetical protein